MHFLVKLFIKIVIVIVVVYKIFFLILDYISFLEEKGILAPFKKKRVTQYYEIKPHKIDYDQPQSFLPLEFEQWREEYIKKYNKDPDKESHKNDWIFFMLILCGLSIYMYLQMKK